MFNRGVVNEDVEAVQSTKDTFEVADRPFEGDCFSFADVTVMVGVGESTTDDVDRAIVEHEDTTPAKERGISKQRSRTSVVVGEANSVRLFGGSKPLHEREASRLRNSNFIIGRETASNGGQAELGRFER